LSPVAIVTGASRGIGKGCAIHLARAGFDVVIGARTLVEGDPIEHSLTVKRSDVSALSGSLASTAEAIQAEGRRALVVKLDLLQKRDIEDAVARALAEFGRVDVLVNNGRYVGPGHMDLAVDTPIEIFEQQFQINVLAPLHLIKLVAPEMAKQGGGVVMNVSSLAGSNETAAQPGEGGWGLGYSITKAAFNRLAAGLGKELQGDKIAVINLEPGFVVTERTVALKGFGFDVGRGLSVDVPGLTCAALATHPHPMFFSGTLVHAPRFVVEHELVDPQGLPKDWGPESWGLPPKR
jgi:NAD(P)-dependent dehydrogenase (short-subunit alcohol dehydrogenase family)